MSAGSSTERLVFQTKRKYSAAATPTIVCTGRDRAKRFRTLIATTETSARRRCAAGIRIEQPVQVDDEVTHVGVVHGAVRLRPPGRVGGRVVRKDADDVDLGEILEFDGVQ